MEIWRKVENRTVELILCFRGWTNPQNKIAMNQQIQILTINQNQGNQIAMKPQNLISTNINETIVLTLKTLN